MITYIYVYILFCLKKYFETIDEEHAGCYLVCDFYFVVFSKDKSAFNFIAISTIFFADSFY